MAGTGYLAKGIAGTLGAILSSSSSSSHQQQQHGQGDEGLHMGARGRVLLAGGSSSRVLIFVVGGISMQELRRASIERIALQQQAMDDQGEGGVQRMWIGGTSLIASPLEACRCLIL